VAGMKRTHDVERLAGRGPVNDAVEGSSPGASTMTRARTRQVTQPRQ
jgi:hypothetical protein